MGWIKRAKPSPRVTDLSHLLEPGWTGGKVVVGESAGVVTLAAENLTRDDDGQDRIDLIVLPEYLQPVQRLLGARFTFRGREWRIDSSGTVQITDPRSITDHLDVTYVARGGA